MKLPRASFHISNIHCDVVFIKDNDGMVSVTNDAEAVVAHILNRYPKHRIIYRDTNGNWDELEHDSIEFSRFTVLTDEDLSRYGQFLN